MDKLDLQSRYVKFSAGGLQRHLVALAASQASLRASRYVVLAFVATLAWAACTPRQYAVDPTPRPAALSVVPRDPPDPSVTRIDYAHPEKHLALSPGMGDVHTIRKIARAIPGESVEDKLLGIRSFLNARLLEMPSHAYTFRNFQEVLVSGAYGGCADYSLVFGSITRALGIPTVWVKTMDADWIREFKRTHGHPVSWRGHVFLELYLDGQWVLFDAMSAELYREYDTHANILPGNRFAYDKGDDPATMVLSTDWQRWIRQTRRFFFNFDLSRLPVGTGESLRQRLTVFVIADSPVYKWIAQRYAQLGWETGLSFNMDFEKNLKRASGGNLIVTVIGGHYVLPLRYWPTWTGVEPKAVEAAIERQPYGVLRGRAQNGTRVTIVYADTSESVKELLKEQIVETPNPVQTR